jgi:sirohydrochlorin cobaltochelatase
MPNRNGIILFGHGARDARWAEPFERLAEKLRSQCGPDTLVALAFLELMSPDLPTSIAEQAAAGCTTVTVVPVFVGIGGHIRRDLPAVIDQCRAAHPGVDIRCAAPVGEDDAVLDALARYCLRQIAWVDCGKR